jgi:hypothetical protein
MKTYFIFLCLVITMGIACGGTGSGANQSKATELVLESATWSYDAKFNVDAGMGGSWEVSKIKGNYTRTGGGSWTEHMDYQDTNQATFYSSDRIKTIAPDFSIVAEHFADSLGYVNDTIHGGISIAMEAGKLSVYNITNSPSTPLTASKSSKVKMMLHIGGGGGAGQQALVDASGSAQEQLPRPIFVTGGTNIPYPQITIEGLGKNLDEDGLAYGTAASSASVDVTQKASVPMHGFTPGAGAPVLAHHVACVAAGNTNLARTTLGVGEVVSVFFSSDATGKDSSNLRVPITWTTSAGSIHPLISACGTVLTSPSNAASAKVTATVRGESVSVDFGVVAPSGIKATIRDFEWFDIGYVGAGMYLNVVLQPTSVSFNRVQIKEPGAVATKRKGYFEKHAPPNHDSDHGANKWHPVNCDNLVVDGKFDLADSYGWPIGRSGSYTWPINPIWSIEGDDSNTNSLSGWTDQVHTLSADGTMTVNKLDRHVTRSPF